MFTIIRTQTCKSIFAPETEYYTWNRDKLDFSTEKEVSAWLENEYGRCKRTKMYQDGDDGTAVHVGHIYHYITPKCSYGDTNKNNQDWIEIMQSEPTRVIIK